MRFILYFLLLVAPPVWAQDADFLAAYDAFRAGDKIKLQRLVQRLKNKPLEVYLNYYQLRLELDRADTQQVLNTVENEMRKFLSRTEDTPMIDQLRGEWLKWLASQVAAESGINALRLRRGSNKSADPEPENRASRSTRKNT